MSELIKFDIAKNTNDIHHSCVELKAEVGWAYLRKKNIVVNSKKKMEKKKKWKKKFMKNSEKIGKNQKKKIRKISYGAY